MKIKAISRISKPNERFLKECLCGNSITYGQIKEHAKEVRPFMPPFFLCLESNQVIGCLCLYEIGEKECYGEIFLGQQQNPEQVEEMMDLLKEELLDYEFTKLYLSNALPSNPILTPYITIESIDYVMQAAEINAKMLASGLESAKQKGLKLYDYHAKKDQEFYVKLLVEVFNMGSNESLTRSNELISDTSMSAYILRTSDGQAVGMTGCYEQSSSITIFDVAIEKKQQGSGYGKAMLSLLFDRILQDKKVLLLQVNSNSAAACHLYEQFGFEVTQQMAHPVINLLQP